MIARYCLVVATVTAATTAFAAPPKTNVLFIISDDLTYTALSCYGNTVCQTPHIDRLAARGTRFTRAYCQGTYCGPSRASFMTGYYPHATGVLGYGGPRPRIGDRVTWSQLFKINNYYAAHVIDLANRGRVIAVTLEVLRKRDHIRVVVANVCMIARNTRGIRPHACHQARPRRIADRLRAVRSPENHAGRRERIDVRTVNVRMAVAARLRP